MTAGQADSALKAEGGSTKILLVDDDPVVLKALSLRLKSQGYQVVTASDASQALSATRQYQPDLMLMDVQLPQEVGGVAWNGFSLVQWLRRMDHVKNTPVIVISASDRPEYKQRATAVGATAFLQKPINPDELLSTIDTAFVRKAGGESATPAGLSQPETYKNDFHLSASTTDSEMQQVGRDSLTLGGI
jgi:two-component system, OmpR family, KDP operon response regulator KdpE